MREIVFDTETTGLDWREERVIELGCIELVNRFPTGRTFHKYINPQGREIHPDAQAVHGIYPKDSTGGLSHEDLSTYMTQDPDGRKYQVVGDKYNWRCGLAVRDWRGIVRIANVPVAAPGKRKGHLHGNTVARLRNLIVTGVLAPGTKLNERELCDQLAISRTPVREAIKTLIQDGLLRALPNHSAVVSELDLDEVVALIAYLDSIQVRW